jgi:hypothetical protein
VSSLLESVFIKKPAGVDDGKLQGIQWTRIHEDIVPNTTRTAVIAGKGFVYGDVEGIAVSLGGERSTLWHSSEL